jgi:hypothetical protein
MLHRPQIIVKQFFGNNGKTQLKTEVQYMAHPVADGGFQNLVLKVMGQKNVTIRILVNYK